MQDGGRRHLELLFCYAGLPTKPVCGPKLALQILHWSSLYFSTYRDLKISQIWLKMRIQAPKIMFLGSFDHYTLLFITETPKRHFFAQKYALWALICRDRSYGVTWTRGEVYKKKKEPKVSQNLPFCRPPSRRPTSTKFHMQGRIPDIFLGFKFQEDRLKNMGAVGVKFLAFPLTWHIAHMIACCYRTSRD